MIIGDPGVKLVEGDYPALQAQGAPPVVRQPSVPPRAGGAPGGEASVRPLMSVSEGEEGRGPTHRSTMCCWYHCLVAGLTANGENAGPAQWKVKESAVALLNSHACVCHC